MSQNRENKEKSIGLKKLIIYLYLGLMVLVYSGYILVDNYRLSKAEQWINTINLSQTDLQNIQQLGFWTSTLEVSFSILMLLAAFLLFRYQKSRKSFINFIILHLCLFAAISLLAYALSFFLIAPIGNLIQPLLLSTFLLVLIIIIRFLKTLQSKHNKSVY